MKTVLYAALGCLASYLLFTFYFVSFDISTWSAGGRYMCAVGFVMSVVGAIMPWKY